MNWKLRSISRLWMREDQPDRIDWPALLVLVLYTSLATLLIGGFVMSAIFACVYGALPDRGAGFR